MDPDSPLVRLSFRDLMWYCYLEQDHLDSSFFRMEDPFRKLKSRDAMRFVTGLHSDRMNQLDVDLVRAVDEQRSKREAVKQLRVFMARFEMGTEFDIMAQIGQVDVALREAQARRDELERTRSAQTHAVEPLRQQLRELSGRLEDGRRALGDVALRVQQYEDLRSELIASKVKLARAEQAGRMLQGVEFKQCPQCGSEIAGRVPVGETCGLCGSPPRSASEPRSLEREALRRELNERIDDLAESLNRHKRDKARQERFVAELVANKGRLDQQLTADLSRYDTAYVSSVRAADRDVATLQERRAALDRLRELPQAINELEEQAGALQGRIDSLRSGIEDERAHLRVAYERTRRIATHFFELMRGVGFPGVYEDDHVEIDPRTWLPSVHHQDLIWGFGDAGSGGKKTLFNVLYALAVHQVAAEEDLPLPTFLIVDSPTKNISEDENPELVKALYRAIYSLAARDGRALQFILIDSDLVAPDTELREFAHRRMAGTAEEPCLISYYSGP
jgi:DNA repair exonuclease SbcCD ATPase subunit